jgi:thiamine-phosphate pyrophosphorylase
MRADSLGDWARSLRARAEHDVNAEARCRIYAVMEARAGALARLEAALAAGEIAALLVAAGDGPQSTRDAAAELVAAAQRADVAALIGGDPELARALRADGVHLAAPADGLAGYRDARRLLGPSAIIGADCGTSRHVAMSLAEAGADYIGFGAPRGRHEDAQARARRDELVAWWAAIFEVPCVAFNIESAAEAEALRTAGADFLAVTLPCGQPAVARGLIAEIAAAMGRRPVT